MTKGERIRDIIEDAWKRMNSHERRMRQGGFIRGEREQELLDKVKAVNDKRENQQERIEAEAWGDRLSMHRPVSTPILTPSYTPCPCCGQAITGNSPRIMSTT